MAIPAAPFADVETEYRRTRLTVDSSRTAARIAVRRRRRASTVSSLGRHLRAV